MRNLAIAALLCTTAMSSPAHAGPVAAFVGGFLNAAGLGGAALLSSAYVGAWTVGFNAASFLAGGTFLSRLIVSIGLSALSSALLPRPNLPPPLEVMTNYAQDVSPVEYVYGQVRKGGPFGMSAYARGGATVTLPGQTVPTVIPNLARRHFSVILAGHSIEGIQQHYLDQWAVETNATGFVTTPPVSNRCLIRKYLGHPGQVADPLLVATFPEITASDNFAGLAHAVLYADRPRDADFADVYPSGREWTYAPVIKGWDQIYDPRTDSVGYSNNAALVIAHAAVNIYGKSVYWPEVAIEADRCDELVTNRSGGTQRRWTINTTLRSTMTWEETRAHFQMCCDAFFYERSDGNLGFKVGGYDEPDLILTDADFVSLSMPHKADGPDAVGSFAMRYVEPNRDWKQEVTGAVVVGASLQRSEESCFGIDSHNQAWRVIYRWAKTAQPEWRLSGTLKPIGYECMGRRFFRLQSETWGIDTVMEIGMLQRIQGSHNFQINAVSVEEADFEPDALSLEPPPTIRQEIAEDGTVPALASFDAEVVEGTGGIAMIETSWPAQPADLTQQVQIRSPGSGLPDWQIVTAGPGQTSQVLSGLIDLASYELQVRNRTPAGRFSTWFPVTPLTVQAVANTSPPPALVSFGATVTGGTSGLVSFSAPNDPRYAACEIYRGTTNVFASATLVHTEYGTRGEPDTWTNTGLASGTYFYWAQPINASGIGNPAVRSGPASITII